MGPAETERPTAENVIEKLDVAFELYDMAERIMWRNLQRRFPDETDHQIQVRLEDWLRERPGAPYGDAEGVVAGWPRSR